MTWPDDYIPSLLQLGTITLRLDTHEAMKEFPQEIDAKCDVCGSSFRYERGNGFGCPFCGADFHMAHFGSDKKRVTFEGKRFDS